MIDHITLHVSDFSRAKEFYLAALKPLGYELVMEFPESGMAGIGAQGNPDFWINADGAGKPTHIAFTSPDRKTVDAFYEAALAAGAKDNGAPGIRKDYHENYYAAFVLDFDGNNIELVTHKPE